MARPPKKSKRFEYNLESALKFRDLRETQEKEKFSKAEQKYLDELDKEEQLINQEQNEQAELVDQISKGKDIGLSASDDAKRSFGSIKRKNCRAS